MARLSFCLAAGLAVCGHFGGAAATAEQAEELSALAADDECAAHGDGAEGCALNALQVRGAALAKQGSLSASQGTCTEAYQDCRATTTCCDEMLTCFEKDNYWASCQRVCTKGDWTCKVLGGRLTDRSAALGAGPVADGYAPAIKSLLAPSKAPLYTFYMYRCVSDSQYEVENVNAANLAGALWYLQNEVVIQKPRKFGITRILRVKVQTKAPQPLFERGMNFGVRYAFDAGNCTGPWSCDEQWAKYGYFIGCNNLGEFPFPTFKVYYPGAVWYSLPGPCPNKLVADKKGECVKAEPGGACLGTPTGQGHCTFSYELAGEIKVDDLEDGFGNPDTFWEGPEDEKKCSARLELARSLFAKKYPDTPQDKDWPTPKCDFNRVKFFDRKDQQQ